MASALEFGGEECVDNLDCHFGLNEACRKNENVGVVVGTGQTGQLGRPAESGADTLVFVKSHTYAVAATTEGDAGIAAAALDSFGTWVGEIGIIATVGAEGAEILDSHAARLEVALDHTFKLVAGVVAAHTGLDSFLENSHYAEY